MKKIIFTILVIQFSFLVANAQWVTQNSGTINHLRDIEFINRFTGWACGDGVIMKTTNAGTNWVIQTQPATNKYLYSINPVNENIVYCVGWFETILKTTNGGINWLAIRNGAVGSGASYWASYFINVNTGWIAGSSQKILKTTNGGITFDSISVSITNIMDIYFKDSMNGVLCGEIGLVRKTTNGGINWLSVNIQLYGNMYNFYKMSFVNNQYGWLVGNINPVYRTTDFGNNWDSIGYVTGSDETYCVKFSSVLTGWAGGSYGRMFKSTDGGFTWHREQGTSTSYISNYWFYNDSIGWLAGAVGKILYTTTSGQIMNITNSNEQITNNFNLYQNYPNPFNSQTNIEFEVIKEDFYKLELFDIVGKKIDLIFNVYLKQSNHKISYNAEKLSTGIYYYRLSSEEGSITKKLLIIK